MTRNVAPVADRVSALLNGEAAALSDPFPLFRSLRELGGVHEHGGLLLLMRYEDVKEAYRAGDSFARGQTRGAHLLAEVQRLPTDLREAWHEVAEFSQSFMIRSRYDEHERLRKITHRAFTPRRIAALDQSVREHAEKLLAELDGREVVDITPFAYRMPLLVLMDMLGIPADDQEMVHEWSGTITAQIGSIGKIDPETLTAALGAKREFTAYIEAMLEQRVRRVAPHSDLLADLLDAEGDGRMTPDEITAMFAELLIAGHETTTALIGNGLLELLRRPDQWRWLCTHLEQTSTAIEELLRYISPVATNPRAVEGGVTFGGREYPSGTTVLPFVAAANRDPEVFDDPERLDLTRADVGRHIAFGFGPHFCIGNQLARREGATAMSAIARRFPAMKLDDEAPEWFGTVMLRRPRRILVSPQG